MLVEICANSLRSALNAQNAGADRIELCSELAVGGITPSLGLLKAVRQAMDIPVHVLIRPRSGDFTYSDEEFEIMKSDIATCVELDFDGIVSGVLNKDFTLDVERTDILIEASQNLKFTFHRAFDWIKNPMESVSALKAMGAHCILTSGQAASAVEGIDLLTELNRQSGTMTIMPGGGINPDNILLFKQTDFKAVHLSASRFVTTLAASPKIQMNSPSFLKEDALSVSDSDVIRRVIQSVR